MCAMSDDQDSATVFFTTPGASQGHAGRAERWCGILPGALRRTVMAIDYLITMHKGIGLKNAHLIA